jgi:hypothetical protein
MFAERLLIGPAVLIIGVLLCFAGYRLFRVLITIWGFFIGFFIGAQIIASIFGQGFLSTPLAWVVGLVAGIVLAAFACALYAAAFTMLGAGLGYLAGVGLMTASGITSQGSLVIIVGLVFAVSFAIITLALNVAKIVIIVDTALSGAGATILGILLLSGEIQGDFLHMGTVRAFIDASPGWVILWVAIAVLGGLFQMQHAQRYRLEKYVFAQKEKLP